MKFHVKIEQDEDGFFLASVPALPGCYSDGKTEEEAHRNIQEAMELWLEAEDAKAVAALPEAERKILVEIAPRLLEAEAA
ncbi:type II toxin-antitoxin system HicB family antitoxin [Terriglobus sp. RCC_193]|uniref:type II toxin-antitoxin system HicB family antitoxin n=1 Tax=Terriglobus sp. RCC_193 TaxID=3239218 RepID=UPI0035260024